MAGGVKKPINIFKLKNTGDPPQIFNWRLWFAVLAFGLMGAARGVDEGLINGAFKSPKFQKSINLKSYSEVEQTNIKGNVSAMVQIGSEVPTSLHLMFATTIFCLSFLQYESPRFLIRKGRIQEAISTLSHIRKLPPTDPYIVHEIHGIETHWQEEQEATLGQGWLGILKEIFLVRSNFYRLYLGFFAQIMSQWSGAGSITLYAVDLFALLGIKGNNESLLATAIFGIVKFCAAVACALFLVDVIGRKRALLLGITLQAIAMTYIAGFLSAVPKLGVDDDFELPDRQKGASIGAIFMIYLSGFGWALGWNSMQYLLTAELFPLRIRAINTGIVMAAHFANQYGNSRAVPNMLLPVSSGGMDPKGTFWFFAAVTVLGGIWVLVTVPETAGRDLESMDRLFALPWYKIGLYGNRDADVKDEVANEKESPSVTHVEKTKV
ncbi:hypothetical protein DV736_g4650, partial [Chaetothyriales sp. CBS 134916]